MNPASRTLLIGTSSLLFLFVTIFSICHIYLCPMLVDDAYIGFRIARNFAAGHGLVFNSNEYVMTSTTTLYALLNGVLWKMFGDKTILYILLLNTMWHALTVCFLFSFVHQTLRSKTSLPVNAYFCSLFAALFFVLSASVSIIATCGMETPFYTFFICLTFYLYFADRLYACVLVSTIPFLIRPEGFLVAGVIILFAWLERRKIYPAHVCIIAAVVISFFLALYSYYGVIIPQSIPAKRLYEIDRVQEIKEFLLAYFFSLRRLPLGFFFFSGLYYTLRINRQLLPFIVWGLLYAAFFTLLASWWKWYKPPFYMMYSCTVALGVYFWAEFLSSKYPRRVLLVHCPTLISVLLLIAAFINERKTLTEQSMIYQGFLAGAKNVAAAILQNTSNDEFITVEPLGFISYYAFERKFKDYPGLCSREVVASLKKLGRKLRGTLSDYEALKKLNEDIKPPIFVLRQREYVINEEKGTIRNYRVLAAIPMEFQQISYFKEAGEDKYYVLQRTDSVPMSK